MANGISGINNFAAPIETMQAAKAKNDKRGKELDENDLLALSAEIMAMSFNPMDESGGGMNVGDMYDNMLKMRQVSAADKQTSAIERLTGVIERMGALGAIGKSIVTQPIEVGPAGSGKLKSLEGTIVSFDPNADGGAFRVRDAGGKEYKVKPDQIATYNEGGEKNDIISAINESMMMASMNKEDIVKGFREGIAMSMIGKEVETTGVQFGEADAELTTDMIGTILSYIPGREGGKFKVNFGEDKIGEVNPGQILSYRDRNIV